MEHTVWVGIDVAKDHLDVHLRPTDEAFRVPHDADGVATLLARLRAVSLAAARKPAARSSSRRTRARTGSPRARSSPVTVRPTAPS